MLIEAARRAEAAAEEMLACINAGSAPCTEVREALEVAKAQSMRPEQFTKEVRRWAADRQHDGGEADYRRLRARRYVRIWDSDDGTVELHSKFDPVAGRRIGNRLQAEARRLYDTDKKQAANGSGGGERRSFNQCMADALDNLTANNTSANGKPFADICVVAHLDEATGKLVAETLQGQRLPQAVLEELACNAKWSPLAGTATTESTTKTGTSAPAPTGSTPSTHPTRSTTGPRSPPNNPCCSNPRLRAGATRERVRILVRRARPCCRGRRPPERR